jgi:hypothetical protein
MRAVTTSLAALACAALLGAGAAFADADGPAAAPAAGTCPAPKQALPSMEAFARLQARLQAEAEASGDAPVVLNGRGYNYGPARDPLREMQVLQAEVARERAQH